MDFMFFLLSTNFCQSYECISKHHTSASLLFIPLESPHLVWWLQSKPFNSVQSQTVFFCMTKTVCIQMHVWKYYGAHIFRPYSLCFIFFFFYNLISSTIFTLWMRQLFPGKKMANPHCNLQCVCVILSLSSCWAVSTLVILPKSPPETLSFRLSARSLWQLNIIFDLYYLVKW